MLPWAARWLGDFPKALLPTQTWGLRPCIVSSLLKAEEKLSVVIELGHPCKMCSLCCKCREKANCLQSIPQDSGMDVCEGVTCRVGADGCLFADHWWCLLTDATFAQILITVTVQRLWLSLSCQVLGDRWAPAATPGPGCFEQVVGQEGFLGSLLSPAIQWHYVKGREVCR